MDAEPNAPETDIAGERPVVAVFDFDGTLTRRDSLLPFLWGVAGPTEFIFNVAVLLPTLPRYALGLLDNGATKERVLDRFLGGRPVEEIRSVAERFAEEQIPLLLDPEAMDRLQWHTRRGDTTILVSASPELYLRPWAEVEGFDAVIGTQLETTGKAFTGRFSTPNCHGSEKTRRLEAEGPPLTEKTIYAYDNSRGDRELIDRADRAFYRTFADPNEDQSDENGSLPNGWQCGLLLSVAGGMGLYLGLTVWSGADQILQGLCKVPLPTFGGSFFSCWPATSSASGGGTGTCGASGNRCLGGPTCGLSWQALR